VDAVAGFGAGAARSRGLLNPVLLHTATVKLAGVRDGKWGALLFELVRHAGESGVELAAEGGHGADCRNGDEDGDERILDRGCAGFVARKS